MTLLTSPSPPLMVLGPGISGQYPSSSLEASPEQTHSSCSVLCFFSDTSPLDSLNPDAEEMIR